MSEEIKQETRLSEIHWRGKSIEELLRTLHGLTDRHGASIQVQNAIHAKLIEELGTKLTDVGNRLAAATEAGNRAVETGNKLARNLLWLNIILAALTFIGVFYTALQFYK